MQSLEEDEVLQNPSNVATFAPVNCELEFIAPLSSWLVSQGSVPVIAGPCSAESEMQVLDTARALAFNPSVAAFRAGVWKPRTRPSGFEGMGEDALRWLKLAKSETGLKPMVEVASPRHVELALRYDVDMLWIGARTTVNPFLVQEIAKSLEGHEVALLVKNPVNPDPDLWLGAIERFYQAGIRKLAAVHRGFSFYRKRPWRNAPMWELPIELKRRCPSIPVITDPSHICGNRTMLSSVAQKALDLEMDGLMLEVHPHPAAALTDKNQQITPDELSELLASLVVRRPSGDQRFEMHLEQMRSEIDRLDVELMEILARRMEVIDEIGNYKLTNRITILQIDRWREILTDRLARAESLGLDRQFVARLLEIVHNESIRRQELILNQSGSTPLL